MELILFPLMGLAIYFALFRPQQQKAKEHAAMMKSLEEGDEIITTSGIFGFISAMEGETVWVEVSDGMELKVAKAYIASKVVPEETDVEDDESDDEAEELEEASE